MGYLGRFFGAENPDQSADRPDHEEEALNRSDTTVPSVGASPAYPNATIIVASRTPQPAMEIGNIVISMIGGTSRNSCSNAAGAAIERTAHQAITTAMT